MPDAWRVGQLRPLGRVSRPLRPCPIGLERAIIAHRFNHTLYLKYVEFEMKNKFVNRARNIWDRAIAVCPRVDQVWYKYIHMEQMLGNFSGAGRLVVLRPV